METKKLIGLLTSKEVVETLTSVIQPIIAQSIAAVAHPVNELKASIDELRAELSVKNDIIDQLRSDVSHLQSMLADRSSVVDELRSSLTTKSDTVDQLCREAENLQSSLVKTEARLELLETYTRVDNIVIKGLPELAAEVVAVEPVGTGPSSSESTLLCVLDFFENQLGLSTTPADISIAHRMPRGKFDKVRPTIVRFTNRRARDMVYKARRQLRVRQDQHSPIYINEHLTKHSEVLYSQCRKLWKDKVISGTWSWHGVIYAKKHTNQVVKILTEEDVTKLSR